MQPAPSVRSKADYIARVWGYLGFEKYDVEHYFTISGISLEIYHLYANIFSNDNKLWQFP
jgi:hypothetical protein